MFVKQISNKSCRVKIEIYIDKLQRETDLLAEEYSSMVEHFSQNQPKTNQKTKEPQT